jgi:outer membrane protein assembly factor BamE (lipoprotein component of BamABCDE complex)
MKKSKFFLVAILLLTFSFLLYKCSVYISRIENTDYEYNTVFTNNYDEKLFNNYLIGKTNVEILEILGKPMKKQKLEYYNAILYTNKKDSIDMNHEYGIEINCIGTDYKFLKISFDSSNKITEIFNREYYPNEDDLKKLSKEDVIKVLGFPYKELKRPSTYDVWTYSKIKEGGYTGKQPKIHIRHLIFHRNKVLKVIKEKGYAYDLSIGTFDNKNFR